MHTISIGFSSQWNLGRKMHSWPASWMSFSSIDSCFAKSSCLLSRQAMQQFRLSHGHTGLHFARNPLTSNPPSSSTCWRLFGVPLSSIIFCIFPRCLILGLDLGMTVLCCLHCFPPFDLFISNAFNASGGKEAWADDWSKINSEMQLGCSASNICIAPLTCLSNCSVSHH